jgi:hypothetical protein
VSSLKDADWPLATGGRFTCFTTTWKRVERHSRAIVPLNQRKPSESAAQKKRSAASDGTSTNFSYSPRSRLQAAELETRRIFPLPRK